MILAPNHRPRLSGNNPYWLLLVILLCVGACSPKIRTAPSKKAEEPIAEKDKKEGKSETKKFTQANISLLIPFKLNQLNLKTATKAQLEEADMAIDFYQGFKLGIDSAAAGGLNFKLNVYDTRNDNSQVDGLIKNGGLLSSQLIVGPVFSDGQKHIANYVKANNLVVVSPLSATHPDEFNNPNLISITNNIDLHVAKIGDYIVKNFNPENTVVVLINPKKPDDEVMAAPVRGYFQDLKFTFQEYASVYTMETKIIPGKLYVVIVTSSTYDFVLPTLSKLAKMKNAGLNINLFGHPDWMKQSYSTENLQLLNTMITSSYKIDYKRKEVIDFIKAYRSAFNFEPGEFSFKGFDVGFYFGTLLSKHGADYLKYLTKDNYKGLHNSFSFYYNEQSGYINKDLMLLRYKDFALNTVE